MKKLIFLALLAVGNLAFGQTESEVFKKEQLEKKNVIPDEVKQKFATADFSKIWTHTENKFVYGFIGDDYQRIRIKFITVTKTSPDTYTVYGKSMVKGNIDDFHGTIKIADIRKLKVASPGLENLYKIEGIKGQYIIVGDYSFAENKNQNHSGSFKGTFRSDFFVDKDNKINYDDLESMIEGYNNNQFAGSWIAYKGNLTQKCNWGDYRIPYSEDLDSGTSDFTPTDDFKKNGWETVHDSGDTEKKSKLIEDAKWWVR
jgi:hypothetical protein